jgi:chromatin structure-remodeling complex protein RSC7
LNRDGLNEENWMFIAAQRTMEAGEAFAKIRKEALEVCGGVQVREELPIEQEVKKRTKDGGGGGGKRRKLRGVEELPLGAYEAHSGIVHCKCPSYLRLAGLILFLYPCDRSCGHSADEKPLGSAA